MLLTVHDSERWYESAYHTIYAIRDERVGIPETDVAYLFQPFHRAGNVGQIPGTGLG